MTDENQEQGTEVAQVPMKKAELVAGSEIKGIVPRNIEELHRMAHGIVLAGIVPDSYKSSKGDETETISRVAMGIQKSLEVGLPPLTGLSNIMIVNNRPLIWGDAAIALVQSKGVVDWVKQEYEGEGEKLEAVYKIKRRGQEHPYEGRFSTEDAKKAKLLGKPGPWMTYTKRMLMNRARAYALRDGFSDCLSGLSIAEEMQDIPVKPEIVETSSLDDGFTVSIVPPEAELEEGENTILGAG